MKLLHRAVRAILVSFLACMPVFAQMTGASAQPELQMNAASRQQLIDSLVKEVNDSYVFSDVAKQVAASLRAQQRRGAYDTITGARQFADVLSRDMQTTARDRHLRVMYSEAPLPAGKPDNDPAPDQAARQLAFMRSTNFGVEKVEQLPFNIGYLNLVSFAPARNAAETLAAAMIVLTHTDALIIDLRSNEGGDAGTVALLASYLLDERTRLNDFYYREGNRIEQRWSSDAVPGRRYGQDKPVYVLTSKDTFSAAEDFTYALKNLRRVTVVGATTGGGANPGDVKRLLPHFSAFVPLGRSVSPITQANWEGVGVTPDVAVCAADALSTAQAAILTKMAAAETNTVTLAYLRDRIAKVGAGPATSAGCP